MSKIIFNYERNKDVLEKKVQPGDVFRQSCYLYMIHSLKAGEYPKYRLLRMDGNLGYTKDFYDSSVRDVLDYINEDVEYIGSCIIDVRPEDRK